MRYTCYIFDFDYTLGDSTGGVVLAANYALKKLGFAVKDHEIIRRSIGMSLPNKFKFLSGCSDEDKAERFTELFLEEADKSMLDNTFMYPDSIRVLSEIRLSGCRLGIVTTKYRRRIISILDKFEIDDMIDVIIGGDDVKYPKPHPMALLTAIEKLKVDKNDVVYIGDNLIDAKTAAAAGVDFIAVTTGTNTREEFEKHQNVMIIDSLKEIYFTIKSS